MGNRKPVEIAPDVYWYAAGPVAGNIYFVQSASTWVVVDTATAGAGKRIREVADALFGVGARPAAILLTHVHPDHSGSAHELAQAWDCPVYLHPDEKELAVSRKLATVDRYANPLDRRVIVPLLRLFPRRWVEAMMAKESLAEVVQTFEPDTAPPGLPEWTSIATPGHSPGHTSFFRQADRVLIAGDALLTVDAGSFGGVLSWVLHPDKPQLCEPPWYTNWDRDRMLASAGAVVRLQPKVLASGHGHPLADVAIASALNDFVRRQSLAHHSSNRSNHAGTLRAGDSNTDHGGTL